MGGRCGWKESSGRDGVHSWSGIDALTIQRCSFVLACSTVAVYLYDRFLLIRTSDVDWTVRCGTGGTSFSRGIRRFLRLDCLLGCGKCRRASEHHRKGLWMERLLYNTALCLCWSSAASCTHDEFEELRAKTAI